MESLDLIHGGSSTTADHPLLNTSGADPMLSAAFNVVADEPLSPPFDASRLCAGANDPDEDTLYEVRYSTYHSDAGDCVLSPSVKTIRYASSFDYGSDAAPGSGGSQLYDCHFIFGDETADSLYASPSSSAASAAASNFFTARLGQRTVVNDNDTTTALLPPTMLLDGPRAGILQDSPDSPPSENQEPGANSAELPSSASSDAGPKSSHFAFGIDSDSSSYGSGPSAKRAKFSAPSTTSTGNYDGYASVNTGPSCCYEMDAVPTVRVITKYNSQLPPSASCITESLYNKAGSNESPSVFKYSNGSNSGIDNFYDSTTHATEGTVGSSNCSTPSSISSTINSVVVKSLNYSSNGRDSYSTTNYGSVVYAPLAAGPMNIIVNDMSSHQQPTSTQHALLSNGHQFDIKVEPQPKCEYNSEYAPYTLVAASPYHPHTVHHGGNYHHAPMPSTGSVSGGLDSCEGELDELNTLDLAQRISQELKRYSIPQAIFAQSVLCRSQGTLSDLLRNPKPWSKLKSGRKTFRRMAKWLQEPEFQRMSSLRIAACKRKEEQNLSSVNIQSNLSAASPMTGGVTTLPQIDVSTSEYTEPLSPRPSQTQSEYSGDGHQLNDDQGSPQPQQPKSVTTKKPRLVFTDMQQQTLYAIFKENKRPSREMQLTISQQLALDPNTVANFFMNARRRSHTLADGCESDTSAAVAMTVSLPGTPSFSSSGSESCSGLMSPTPALVSVHVLCADQTRRSRQPRQKHQFESDTIFHNANDKNLNSDYF